MKRPKLSELTSKRAILERIGGSEVNYCDRNNVFAEYELTDDTLTLYIHGYANSHIAEQWQSKINPAYTIQVAEREEDNVLIYTITLK